MTSLEYGLLFWLMFFVGFTVTYFLVRCRHKWDLLTDRDFPSYLEEAKKQDYVLTWESKGRSPSATITERNCRKKYVAIVKCDKCGGIKKFEITN